MKLGMVGLGRMGGNMAERLRDHGHEVVGYDVFSDATDVGSLEDLVAALPAPRLVWVMVPAGDPTEDTIKSLSTLLAKGDVVVEGGNSNWRDSARRAEALGRAGLGYIDAGTSGGVWGRTEGYCLMVGGAAEHVAFAQPVFDALAPRRRFRPHRRPGHRPLHQDGPQRHRVRAHAGLRRGLRAARALGPRHRREGRAVGLAGGERGAVVAPRPLRARPRTAPGARRPGAGCTGLGRGSLDRAGGDRARCRHAGDQRGPPRAVREPGRRRRGHACDRRPARAVRWARRAARRCSR